jgi:Transposase IS116/IS110/IS902 family
MNRQFTLGVGTLTTATALVSIQNIRRFPSVDALKAYWASIHAAGKSGKQETRSHMANHGNKLMQHRLLNAAKSAARHSPLCRDLFERLIAKGKSAQAAYGAVAHKLVQIIYGVLKTLTKFNPSLKSTRQLTDNLCVKLVRHDLNSVGQTPKICPGTLRSLCSVDAGRGSGLKESGEVQHQE